MKQNQTHQTLKWQGVLAVTMFLAIGANNAFAAGADCRNPSELTLDGQVKMKFLVHDLGVLVALVPDDKIPPGGFSLNQLTPYASIRRYEESNAELGKEEIAAVLKVSADVLAWAEVHLKD